MSNIFYMEDGLLYFVTLILALEGSNIDGFDI
jgi:hypothetical protein